MFSNYLLELKSLLASFLGEPQTMDDNPQTQYCCPCCAERKMIQSDGKYKLECNFEKGVYKCWVCDGNGYDDMKGRISQLIKKYGNYDILKKYYAIVKEMKANDCFLSLNDNFEDNFVDNYKEVILPYGFKKITKENKEAAQAYEYLKKRGLNDYFINTYNLGFIGENTNDVLMRNRIVIPSYNQYNSLNYWVARDYTGNSKLRYKNPKIEKKQFVFNEKLINWYDNITLVEGVFDHMVVPNSVPLLGKVLNENYALYPLLYNNAKCNVNIFLDDDAQDNAIKLYKFLNKGRLKDRIRLISPPEGYDASKIYEEGGVKAILDTMRSAEKLDDFSLQFIF